MLKVSHPCGCCVVTVNAIIGISLLSHPTTHILVAQLDEAKAQIVELKLANKSLVKDHSNGIAQLEKERTVIQSELYPCRLCDVAIYSIIGLNLLLVPPNYLHNVQPNLMRPRKQS